MLGWLVVVLALAFGFGVTNGFFSGGGLVSTVVATRVMEPLSALLLVAAGEFVGLFVLGKAVAVTLGFELFHWPASSSSTGLLAMLSGALMAASLWNLVMWRLSLPSSSSHAMLGGLAGSTIAFLGWGGLDWRLFLHLILLLLVVPVFGLLTSFVLTRAAYWLGGFVAPSAKRWLRRFQVAALAVTALACGSNDGQKTLGLMALAYSAWAGLRPGPMMPAGLVILSGAAIACGVIAGSQRTLKTMGRRFYRVQETQAFCAETSTFAFLTGASLLGYPLSTGQLSSASILGAGVALRPRGVRWSLVGEIGLAWLVTIPSATLLGFALARTLRWLSYVVS